MTLSLTDDELVDLTRKRRPTAQVRALRALGIDHKVRPDGSVLVLRNSLTGNVSKGKVDREFRIDYS